MPFTFVACARCSTENHPSDRFCTSCGLPLGSAEPDVEAAVDALGPYESPDPADPDLRREVRAFIDRCGLEPAPAGPGWRVVVPLGKDRRQAVYIGPRGTDRDLRPLVGLVSVCGPANQRDMGNLLKLNAMAAEAHFATKTLRGEDYFVVVSNLFASTLEAIDAPALVRRIAVMADGLEERLTRGRDLF
jgi:hypothetical protein